MQTLILVNNGRSEKDMIKDPRRIWPFEWEDEIEEDEVYIPTADEWEELDSKYANKKK